MVEDLLILRLGQATLNLAPCLQISRSGHQSPDASTPQSSSGEARVWPPSSDERLLALHRLQSHFRLELSAMPLACNLAHYPVFCQSGNSLAPCPNFRGHLRIAIDLRL